VSIFGRSNSLLTVDLVSKCESEEARDAVGTDRLSAAAIVIATGARKRRLGIPESLLLKARGQLFGNARSGLQGKKCV
jgi:thioredoxin reductase